MGETETEHCSSDSCTTDLTIDSCRISHENFTICILIIVRLKERRGGLERKRGTLWSMKRNID